MMKTLIIMSAMMSVMVLTSASNPLKASVILLAMSSIAFLLLKLQTGLTWFPLMLFMLFTGGILMTFMILSSVLPNEKTSKMKINKSILILMALIITMTTSMMKPMSKENAGEVKSMITSPTLFMSLTVMILMYFFFSMGMHESEESPMRSLSCCPG